MNRDNQGFRMFNPNQNEEMRKRDMFGKTDGKDMKGNSNFYIVGLKVLRVRNKILNYATKACLSYGARL